MRPATCSAEMANRSTGIGNPPGRAATVVIVLQEDTVTLPALQRSRPDGEVIWTLADDYGRPYAAAYRLPATEAPS